MKKTLLTLYLSAALGAALPATLCAAPLTEGTSVAPSLPAATLAQLSWQPLSPPVKQTLLLDTTAPRIHQEEIQGPVVAIALPADRGTLEITLASEVVNNALYVPNVVVLDEQMRPAAFFPASYFPYQKPGITSGERLEGTMKLTPALGQRQIYLLVYTTQKDLHTTTQLTNPAKAYAEGIGTAVPAIPDPIARHSETGKLLLKVTTEKSSGNIMIGQPFSSPSPTPVVVGSTAQPAAPAPAATAPAKPVLNDTESYFNQGIRQAVQSGNIDKALKLLDEAERLGSTSARQTFISSVKGKG